MGISDSNIKKFPTFSKRKLFLIFWETETLKNFLIFKKEELSYISGNRNPEKLFFFSELRKCKKPTLTKNVYFFRNGTF